jgi:hypothetical protein
MLSVFHTCVLDRQYGYTCFSRQCTWATYSQFNATYSITMYTNYTCLIMALYGFNMKLRESTDKVVIRSLTGEPVLKTSCGGCCMNVCIKQYFYIDVSLHMMRSSLLMDLIYPSAYQVCNKKVYC